MRGELWEKQAELVKRITSIATRADPNNRGLYFRLINEDLSFADNLDGDAILQTLGKIVPRGNTQLGTQLRKRILDPIIRKPLYVGTPLERPYLIMIITDGCPTLEPSDQLRNVILECSQFLGDKGYRKDGKQFKHSIYASCHAQYAPTTDIYTAVRFCLSQIGQNQEARDFMDKLVMDSEVLKVLHRTVGERSTHILLSLHLCIEEIAKTLNNSYKSRIRTC